MNEFDPTARDTVYILKPNGQKLGPFDAAVTPPLATIMDEAADVKEKDKLICIDSSKTEHTYIVTSVKIKAGSPPVVKAYIDLTIE